MKLSFPKRLWFLVPIGTMVMGIVTYTVVRLYDELGRLNLGVERGSSSLKESQSDGFFVGVYFPTERTITLKDTSMVEIPDAWVEHAWKPEFTWSLRDTKVVSNGYNLNIPIKAAKFKSNQVGLAPYQEFTLQLDRGDLQYSRHPGIGYDLGGDLGFMISLDTLPEALTFDVLAKQHADDSWTNATVSKRIQFKRGF